MSNGEKIESATRAKDEQKAVDLAERVRGFGARASGEREVMQLCSAVISLADKVRDLRGRLTDACDEITRLQSAPSQSLCSKAKK